MFHEVASKITGINTRYFFKSGIWTTVKQVFVALAGIATSVAFARLTTKETYGNYQLIMSIFALISIVSIPGLNTSVIQSTARGFEGSYKKAVGISFKWSLLGIPILIAISAYFYFFRDNDLFLPLLVSSFLFPFYYAPNTWESFLQGKERFDVSAIFSIIKNIIGPVLIIASLFLVKNNLAMIVLIYLSVYGLLNIVFYKKSLTYASNNLEDEETIPYGWFVTKLSIISMIAAQFDKIILAFFMGPTELAVYALGLNLGKKIQSLIKSLLSIATPVISRKNTVNFEKYIKIFLVSSVAAASMALAMPFIIPFLYSTKYNESISTAQIIIAFLPFYILGSLYKNHFLFYLKNKKVLFWESILAPSVKICLMVPAIFFFGKNGLAFVVGFYSFIDILVLLTTNKIFKRFREIT